MSYGGFGVARSFISLFSFVYADNVDWSQKSFVPHLTFAPNHHTPYAQTLGARRGDEKEDNQLT